MDRQTQLFKHVSSKLLPHAIRVPITLLLSKNAFTIAMVADQSLLRHSLSCCDTDRKYDCQHTMRIIVQLTTRMGSPLGCNGRLSQVAKGHLTYLSEHVSKMSQKGLHSNSIYLIHQAQKSV